MKILRYHMEDWLNDSFAVEYNLSSSGCQDFRLGEFLKLCGADSTTLDNLYLGDNDTRGSLALRETILQSYEYAGMDNVLVANGTSEALFCFFNQVLEPGDEVIIPFPAFQCLYQIPASIGCNVRFLNLLEAKNWRLDLDVLEDLASEQTKLIIINNPHNPLGWTLSSQELARLGSIASANNASLLFDEHYRYLPLAPGTELIPSGYDICRKMWPKTYATGSMIKCFGIVGIRIGWLLGDRETLAGCRDYKDYLTHTIPSLTDHIALLALKNKELIIERKKYDVLANLAVLNKFMDRHRDSFEYVPPTGGVVCFPRFLPANDTRNFCRCLLEKYGVSILPGFSFEAEQHLRINIGISARRFVEALQRLDICLHDVRHGKHA